MSLFKLSFFAFIIFFLIVYYLFGAYQKYILLAASIVFYLLISPLPVHKTILLMLFISSVTYLGGRIIGSLEGTKRKLALGVSLAALLGMLVITKYLYNILNGLSLAFNGGGSFDYFKFAQLAGISYFTLSATGYLLDVYWDIYKPEKNPALTTLFIFYFPQIISGPVTRFQDMNGKFRERYRLSYDNITFGIRRMLWGYLKKLVISERFSMIVVAVFDDYTSYGGIGIILACLCYAVRLYTDFSGCMDIVLGASMLFGIRLPENFNAPFFAGTAQEYWQRWHISLGTWFRDYVMYPLQRSKVMSQLLRRLRKSMNKKYARKIPMYISMGILWLLLGIWHGGTGYYFIATGIWPFIVLTLEDLFDPMMDRLSTKLRIDRNKESFKCFRRIRTQLVLVVAWVFICSKDAGKGFAVLSHMAVNFIGYTSIDTFFRNLGTGAADLIIMCVGAVILYIAERLKYNGSSIVEFMDKQSFAARVIVIYAEILVIFCFADLGGSEFIYFNF